MPFNTSEDCIKFLSKFIPDQEENFYYLILTLRPYFLFHKKGKRTRNFESMSLALGVKRALSIE